MIVSSIVLRLSFYILGVCFFTYAIAISYLYFQQDRIIFHGTGNGHTFIFPDNSRSITLNDKLGVPLLGWHIKTTNKQPCNIIYFGGNAEDVRGTLIDLKKLNCSDIFTFNYQGYGNQKGKPSEQHLHADAIRIYDFINQLNDHPIHTIGFSLGSAVAGILATNRPVNKLVLMGPISSIVDAANFRYGSIVPAFLIHHPFDLFKQASQITNETLVIITHNDMTVPNSHSLKTFNAINGDKIKVEIKGVEPSEMFSLEQTTLVINRFLGN